MNFKIAINRSFQGKPQKPIPESFWREYNGRFDNETLSIDEIADELAAGHGITTQHNHYRKRSNFVCGQHIGLDFDTEDNASRIDTLLGDLFIWRYASILQPTWSHTEDAPRARVIFLLEKPIYDQAEYTQLATALLWHYGKADPSCKDPCRLFFGGRGEPVVIDNMLPTAVAYNQILFPYLQHLEDEAAAHTRRVVSTTKACDVSQSQADRLYQAAIDRVINAPSGERHYTLWKSVRLVAGYASGGVLQVSDSQIMDDFLVAQSTNGSIEKYGEKDSSRTIGDAIGNGRLQPITEIENYQESIMPHEKTKNYSWFSEDAIRQAAL